MYDQNKTQHTIPVWGGERCLQSEARGIPGIGRLQYFLYEKAGGERADFGSACEKTYDIRICLQMETGSSGIDAETTGDRENNREEKTKEQRGDVASKHDQASEDTVEACDLPDIARSRTAAFRLFWKLVHGTVTPCTAEEIIAELL